MDNSFCSSFMICWSEVFFFFFFKLIVSFEQRISELNETLQEAGESYMEKLAEIQNLQNRLSNQVKTHTDEAYCMAMCSL